MNHLRWLEHSSTLLDLQKNLKNDISTCECDIKIASNGKAVRAHRFILSAASDLFKTILADLPRYEDATIILPDTKFNILENIISFIYTGETSLASQCLSDFLECTNVLGIKSAINFEFFDPQKISAPKIESVNPVSTLTTATVSAPTQTQEIMTDEQMIDEEEEELEAKEEEETTDHREFEYLEVYNAADTEKISYAIEQMDSQQGTDANEYILTESGGQYHLKQQIVTATNPQTQTVTVTGGGEATYTTVHSQALIQSLPPGTSAITTTNTPAIPVVTTEGPALIKKIRKVRTLKTEDEKNNTSIIEIAENSFDLDDLEKDDYLKHRTENLDLAVQAVVQDGMSLQKSAQKYSVAKTVLWRRVKKHPHYVKIHKENPIIETACEKLKAGESLKNISQELEIPMSTLHRHKVRLSMEGRLPDNVAFKKRGSLTKEEFKEKLQKAVDACLGGMSQNHAANVFQIPKSTLWRHLQKLGVANNPAVKKKVKKETNGEGKMGEEEMGEADAEMLDEEQVVDDEILE
ncbi:pfk family protein [Megaselia abdita]